MLTDALKNQIDTMESSDKLALLQYLLARSNGISMGSIARTLEESFTPAQRKRLIYSMT